MKLKIKDNKTLLQIATGVVIIAVIIAIILPDALNAIFGNKISDEVYSVTTDVVSEFDVDYIDGNFAVYNSQGLKKYNNKAEFEEEYYTSAYSPIMHKKGKYIALADTSSAEITVLKGNSVYYEVKVPQNVKRVSVNKKGYITVLSGETGYKSVVLVFDNTGTEKYRWYSDESYAIDAKLSDDSRLLAVASVKMGTNKLNTIVEQYKIKDENVLSSVQLEDLVPYSITFDGSSVVLIGDKKAYTLSKTGKIKSEYDYKGRTLECFDNENKDNIVLALSENMGLSEVVILNEKLAEKGTNPCEFHIAMLDENNGKVAAAGEGNMKVIKSNGKTLVQGEFSKDGSRIVLSDNWRNFAIYSSSSIKMFNIKRGR